MGSWGTGIFQDDFACDVRDLYNELVSLRFEDGEVLAELNQEFGKPEGIEQSTLWIALALLQHKTGRLSEEVKERACGYIDSGRALQDWIDLADEGDSSIRSREKQLRKARATIVSPQPPRKTPHPSRQLKERIDRAYPSYPWKAGNLYSYKTKHGEFVVLAATEVHTNTLERHYSKRGDRYVQVERPVLLQPLLLLLNYRKSIPPGHAELGALKPYVKSSTAEARKKCLEAVDKVRAMHEQNRARTFEEFERQNRRRHPTKSDEEFRQRYLEYIDYCTQELHKYSGSCGSGVSSASSISAS